MSKRKRRSAAARHAKALGERSADKESSRPKAVKASPRGREPAASDDELVIELTPRALGVIFGSLLVLALVLMASTGRLSLPGIPEVEPDASLWLVFLTGLSVGGLSCLAVQGGLLAAMIAQRETKLHGDATAGRREHMVPVVLFLVAKVSAYGLLGLALGFFGSKIPLGLQGWMLIGAGLFMLITALQLYDAHPALRWLTFSPPKTVQRLLRRQSRQSSSLGPVVLGALTVFIPCGVTLAMEFLAIASNSPLRGAGIMLAFTLGTAPLFLAVGLLATQLGQSAYRVFKPVAALTVVAIAVTAMIGGARLLGFGTFAVGSAVAEAQIYRPPVAEAAGAAQAPADTGLAQAPAPVGAAGAAGAAPASTYQEATINAVTGGYTPGRIQLRAGVPTRLNVVTNETRGCVRAFVIPSLRIQSLLQRTGTEVIELPALPAGQLYFMCSMGMYGGIIDVEG